MVRRGWLHAITNQRLLAVASTWCAGPRYGGERRPNGTCHSGLHDDQTATLVVVRRGVTMMGVHALDRLVGRSDLYKMGKTGRGECLIWSVK